jgi:hypothetical protein
MALTNESPKVALPTVSKKDPIASADTSADVRIESLSKLSELSSSAPHSAFGVWR